jgi:kumamolisin
VDKGTNSPGNPNGADGEVMLDIEVSAAVATGANVAVYFAPNTDQGFLDAITTAVHDSTNSPSVLSISWGGAESTWTQQSVTAIDEACQAAATLGVTITVASGDDGSTDGVSGGGNNVDFPASSPHVLGCGGTKLVGSGTTITSEVAWNELAANEGATGGGVSTLFALPSWQDNSNVPKPTTSTGGRGVPDVAGDADPTTGYTIRVDGETTTIGGTSAVAPLYAGLIALANAANGRDAGFVNPILYGDPQAFRDITSGNNGAFSAGPGWDACTGLGSPHGAAVIAALATSEPSSGKSGGKSGSKGGKKR